LCISELKPEEASNSEWPKEAEEKITQLQTTGVANWHAGKSCSGSKNTDLNVGYIQDRIKLNCS
jgi:hypothetical protein